MKKAKVTLPLLTLLLAGCGMSRVALEKVADRLPGQGLNSRRILLLGYVCKPSERIRDTRGVDLGLRFVVAPVGQDCGRGAREVYVAAVLRSEMEKAQRLVVGQSVTIRGELAERAMTPERLDAVADGDSRLLNESVAAESIRINQ
ncbi:MAG TPA: hypothetical protein VLE27_16950 [Thermoanaerobaculia bacterium]|nr:hypothetical protein [Thermoanaerobaculia bacterium]